MSRPPSGPDSKAPCGPRAEPDPQPEPDLQAVSSVLAEALQACRQNVSVSTTVLRREFGHYTEHF